MHFGRYFGKKVTWYECCDLIGFEDFASPPDVTFDQAAQPESSAVLSCYGWASWIQVQPLLQHGYTSGNHLSNQNHCFKYRPMNALGCKFENFLKFVNKHGHFFSKVLAKYSSYKLIVGQKIGKLYLLNVCYLTKRMTSWNKVIISNLCFTSGLNMDVDKELEALFILSKDPMHYITVVEVRRIVADPWLIREVNLEHRSRSRIHLKIDNKAESHSNSNGL